MIASSVARTTTKLINLQNKQRVLHYKNSSLGLVPTNYKNQPWSPQNIINLRRLSVKWSARGLEKTKFDKSVLRNKSNESDKFH